ncbi:MAG: SUMF1/EgtB/PvdO family nonheme iron enzyme [Chloroflexi bacterium]|nr:SUMF1/EgtB/PvdO family nonheme iron enzyme [Chloroflexota bacterium]
MPESTHLGKYEILKEIGRGGFAVVYKARDPKLKQVMALKVLHSHLAGDQDVVQRFLGEASKVVQLKHRGIVRIYAVDEDKGIPYIAMDYLPGGTLAKRLSGEPLPLDGAITIVEQVAAALDHAHNRELVHRDVKPANILFDDEGEAVLVDFGLVKSLAESGLTSKDTMMGTPAYMAPEQANTAAEVDARVDVYALGIVAYEMLTGRVPFEADSPLTVLNAHGKESPPDLCALNKKLDKSVAAVVLKALEKKSEKRYQSAGAFARALRKAWQAVHKAAQAKTTLADLYARVQEAMKANQWGAVVSLCVEIRNINPDYRDVSTLLTLAASRVIEEEQKRQQEREWEEQYTDALELLEKTKYAKAVQALAEIAEQVPDFRDVGERLEQARTELEKEQLYEAVLEKLSDECYDEACADLLDFLTLAPDHADARARLLETAKGLMTQLQDVQSELDRVGIENETARTRVAELETQLKQVQAELKKVKSNLEKSASDNKTLCARMAGLEDRYQRIGSYNEELCARVASLEDELKNAQVQVSQKPQGDLWTSPIDGKEMVRIPAGKFLYGDENVERELPEFWIDKTPITNVEYAHFVEVTDYEPPSHWKGKTPPKKIADHPVVNVSWHDAVAYAEWAEKRLPIEAEWEKAARINLWEYPWGNQQPTPELCNFGNNVASTTSVGKYSPDGDSYYGCVDMAGNVWEWTASEWEGESDRRVLRGGSFNNNETYIRTSYRINNSPINYGIEIGFRCVGAIRLP